MGSGPSREDFKALEKELERLKSARRTTRSLNKSLQTKINAFTEKVRNLEVQRDFAKNLHQKEIERLNESYKERITQLETLHKLGNGPEDFICRLNNLNEHLDTWV